MGLGDNDLRRELGGFTPQGHLEKGKALLLRQILAQERMPRSPKLPRDGYNPALFEELRKERSRTAPGAGQFQTVEAACGL